MVEHTLTADDFYFSMQGGSTSSQSLHRPKQTVSTVISSKKC